jgi:hypothetical protein
MPKRACRGIDAIPADMMDTINPAPAPAEEPQNEVVDLEINEKDNEVFSDGECEDIEETPIPSAEISKKKRQYTEEHKEMLRQRLAEMREKQKRLREEKKAQNASTKTLPKKTEEIFDKKYKDEFDFIKTKIGEITTDISEMKSLKQQKAEAKAKAKAEEEAIKELKKAEKAEEKKAPAPAPEPTPAPQPQIISAPETFIPPQNLSFRQRFNKLNQF